jgi:hypothetical protein
MNSLSHALLLNNEGVLLLLKDREQEAINCLTQSHNMFKHLLAKPSDDSRSASSNPFKALNIQFTDHSLPNLQDSNGFIYSSLLAFSFEAESVPSKDTIKIYRAVIILNIALAYHRKGVGGTNEACLAKAEKMYAVVTKILDGCEDNQGIVLVAKLASINNLSQLRHNQGDYNLSQEGFQYLGDLIDVASENLGSSSSLCSSQMYQGMLLNVLCIAPPDAASAA